MIKADYKALALHIDCNLHARIVDNRVEIKAQSAPELSYVLQYPGFPLDVAFDDEHCYVLQREKQRLMIYYLASYGFFLSYFEVAPVFNGRAQLTVVYLANKRFVVVSEGRMAHIFNHRFEQQILTLKAAIQYVLEFADLLLINQVGGKVATFKLNYETLRFYPGRNINIKGQYLLKLNDCLLCDDGNVVNRDFYKTETEFMLKKAPNNSIWTLTTFYCTQRLVEASFKYFAKHLHFGVSVNFETKKIEKFKQTSKLAIKCGGVDYYLNNILRLAGVVDADYIIDFDVYGNLTICYVLFHSYYYLFAADSSIEQGALLQTCDTRLRFYKGNREYTSIQDLRQRLVYYSYFDFYREQRLQYSYDYPILAVCDAEDDYFYVLTEFGGLTKIYHKYEVVFYGKATMLSMTVPYPGFLVAADGLRMYYFFNGFQADEPMQISNQERLYAKNNKIYIISEFGTRMLVSQTYNFVYLVAQALNTNYAADFTATGFTDQNLLLYLLDYLLAESCYLAENVRVSLTKAVFSLFSPYNFASRISLYNNFELSNLGQLTFEQFRNADDASKVIIFRTVYSRLQSEAFGVFKIPHYSTDLNYYLLLTLLTVVYQQQNYRLFILLALQAGVKLSSVLLFLFDDYNGLRKRCYLFLKMLMRKIKVVTLASLYTDTLEEMRLKYYLITFYDLLELNPINQLIQPLLQTDPLKVHHLNRKAFAQYRISQNAVRYFEQFTDCYASSQRCEVEESSIRYVYVSPDEKARTTTPAGKQMEIADDDDWGQTEKRVRKFKIKSRE